MDPQYRQTVRGMLNELVTLEAAIRTEWLATIGATDPALRGGLEPLTGSVR